MFSLEDQISPGQVLVAPSLITPLIQQLHCYLEMLRSAMKVRRRDPQTYVCLPMALGGVHVSLSGEGLRIQVQSDVPNMGWLSRLPVGLWIGSHHCCNLVTIGTI